MKTIFKSIIISVFFVLSWRDFRCRYNNFDDAIVGATTYQFDSDGDGIRMLFLHDDPSGFNTAGPVQICLISKNLA